MAKVAQKITWSIETWPIERFKPFAKNPRQFTKRGMTDLRKSLDRFGLAEPIVVNTDGTVIGGHARLRIVTERGDATADAYVPSRTLTDKQVEELNIRLNANIGGEWDFDILANEWDATELVEWGLELPDILAPAGNADADAEPQTDRAEELREKWGVSTGQLWTLGEHRLLCGDSTDAADVFILTNGERAPLLFTSPPYSDAREYKGGNLDPKHLSQFINTFDAELYCVNLGIIRKGGEMLTYWDEYIGTAREGGKLFLSWNVWDRGIAKSVGQKTAMFPIEHEFVFVFGASARKLNCTVPNPGAGEIRMPSNRQADGTVKAGRPKVVRDKREIGTVYRGGTIHDSGDHPAAYPVDFPKAYIEACTNDGGHVYEPFSGSGTTIIACEQLGRKCRAIEISPAYVAVALQRYEDATGITPELVNG